MRKTNLNSNAVEQYVSPGITLLSFASEGMLCTSPQYGTAGNEGSVIIDDEDY